VLYALPELDGAIDPVPLGGLVGEDIYLIPERVQRLIGRLKRWIALRQTPPRAANCDCAVRLSAWLRRYRNSAECAAIAPPSGTKDQGYTVGDLPKTEELIRRVKGLMRHTR